VPDASATVFGAGWDTVTKDCAAYVKRNLS
jgi:hypothetical protein